MEKLLRPFSEIDMIRTPALSVEMKYTSAAEAAALLDFSVDLLETIEVDSYGSVLVQNTAAWETFTPFFVKSFVTPVAFH